MSENFVISLDNTKLMLYNKYTKQRKECFTMDETMKNAETEELNEQENPIEKEVTTTEQETDENPLKEAIEAQMRKIQRQSMLLGCQVVCRTTLDKIIATENKPGKTTMADYRRLAKDIKQFCTTGLSRKVNADGETEPVDESTTEETIQN
jgi:hypothetical protein